MAVLGKHTWSVSAFYKLKLSAGYSCHWHTHTVTRKPRSGKKELAIYIKRLFLFYICWWRSVMIPSCSHILHPTDIRASLFSRNVRNPMGCKPFSSFVSNVSSSIEASAILHPYASYKEKFWCTSLEWGAEVGQFSATLTKIGFPLLVWAGPGLHAAPPPGFHQKSTSSFMQVHRSCRIIFIQQYSKSPRAGKVESII